MLVIGDLSRAQARRFPQKTALAMGDEVLSYAGLDAQSNRLARALTAINDWCRANRHQPPGWQHALLAAKLKGHYAYYGITGNMRQLQSYSNQVARLWRKWLARRTRSERLTWARFAAFLAQHPLPQPRIMYRYATGSKALA